MIIYPAMDLIGGGAVRLEQGRFDRVTAYSTDPAYALDQFAAAGAKWAHIVDLDGARAGEQVQHELIAGLARAAQHLAGEKARRVGRVSLRVSAYDGGISRHTKMK